MKLYVVTVREKGNPRCEREVYVRASNMATAERRAVRINPDVLWRPRAVAVRLLGEVY